MKRTITFISMALAVVALAVSIPACASLKQLASLQNLQFKLENASNFKVNGIDISRFSSPRDIGVLEYAKLGTMMLQKKFPVDFTLNVAVKNPNASTSTTTGTGTGTSTIGLRRFAWTLSIDDRTTVNGVVDKLIQIPGDGQTSMIPLTIGLDLYQFFGNNGLDDMLNLAMAIGGANGSASRLKLTARVTVQTPIGEIEYPNAITIVDKQFSN